MEKYEIVRLLLASLLALLVCAAPSAASPGRDCTHGPSGHPGSGSPMGGHFQRCAPPKPPAPPVLPPQTEPPVGPAPPSPPGAEAASARKAGSRTKVPVDVPNPSRKPGPREQGEEIPMAEGVADKPWEVSLGMLAWSTALGISGAGVVLVLRP